MAWRRGRGGRAGRGRRRGARWLPVLVLLVAAAVVAARLIQTRPATAEVFFVRYGAGGHSGTLVPVRRPVPSRGGDERLGTALRALLAGPSVEERRQGLVTEVPPGTHLRSVQVRGEGVVVDLTSAFGGGGGSASMLARVWQVVYTASQLRGVPEVQILLDGRHVQALGGEGVVIGTPLRRPAAVPTF